MMRLRERMVLLLSRRPRLVTAAVCIGLLTLAVMVGHVVGRYWPQPFRRALSVISVGASE
jgi:hypothetical protein